MNNVGETLGRIAKLRGVSQTALAAEIGVTDECLCRWLRRGTNAINVLRVLYALAIMVRNRHQQADELTTELVKAIEGGARHANDRAVC